MVHLRAFDRELQPEESSELATFRVSYGFLDLLLLLVSDFFVKENAIFSEYLSKWISAMHL